MPTEDTIILNVDTLKGQVNVVNLEKKIASIYGAVTKLTTTKDIPSKGITRYRYEITETTKKVEELAKANAALQKSYPAKNAAGGCKNIPNITSEFRKGKLPKTPANLSSEKQQSIMSNVASDIPAPGQQIKSKIPKGSKHGYMDTLRPLPTTPKIGGKFVPLPPVAAPIYNPSLLNIPEPINPYGRYNLPEEDTSQYNYDRYNLPQTPSDFGEKSKPKLKFNPSKDLSYDILSPENKLGDKEKGNAPIKQKKLSFEQTKMGGILKKVNLNLFKLQMASLGVFFSFMGIQNAVTGLFTGLQNLGGTFKSQAMGKTFGGVDVAGAMGVDSSQLVQGWKNITGILGMVQTAMAALAASALTPEVMTAIQTMFLELGKALSDGKVAKALSDIIIAFADMIITIIPLLPIIAGFISVLGESGLLKYIILLVMGAQYLLAGLSLLGFGMQSITVILTTLSTVATALGVGVMTAFGLIVGAAILVILAVDFIINVWENFAATGDIVGSIINGLTDTFWDLYNALLPLMNFIGGFLGMAPRAEATTHSGEYASSQKSIVNNYNFNGNYDDPSAAIKKMQLGQTTSY